MSVIFRAPSLIFSNKPKGDEGCWDRYSYEYEGKNGYVRVLVPKIDKLTLTFCPIGSSLSKDFTRLLQYFAKNPKNGLVPIPSQKYQKKLYKHEFWLTLPGTTERILFQADPYGKKAQKSLRFEFNPSAIGRSGLKAFKLRLHQFFGSGVADYGKLLAEGSVTRADAAVDLINASIADLVFESTIGGKRSAYFGVKGPIEMMYLGQKLNPFPKKLGPSDHYAYDLRQKWIEEGVPDAEQMPPVTRIECRMNTKKLAFWKLGNQDNPLTRLKVSDLGANPPPIEDHAWANFVSACNYVGVGPALSRLPSKLAGKCKEALELGHQVWRPDKLWLSWKRELTEIGLLSAQIEPPIPKNIKAFGGAKKI